MFRFVFLILLFTFTAQPIFAQQRTVDFTELGNVNGRLHVTGEEKPFTGKVVFRYPSGKLKQEAVFVDGRANGPTTAYFESGKKMMEFTNVNDNAHGWMTKWDESGKLVEKTYWKHGEQTEAP